MKRKRAGEVKKLVSAKKVSTMTDRLRRTKYVHFHAMLRNFRAFPAR